MSETTVGPGLRLGQEVTVLVLADKPEGGPDVELVGEVCLVERVDYIALPSAQLLGDTGGVPPTLVLDWWAFSMALGEEREALEVYVPVGDGVRCWRVGVMSDAG